MSSISTSPGTIDVVPDPLQGHVLGDLLGRAHRGEVERAPLRRRAEAVHVLGRQELDRRLVAADQPRQQGLLRRHDGDEVDVAGRRELLGEIAEVAGTG